MNRSRLVLLSLLSIGTACNGDDGATCIAAGTPVHTPSGTRPIESLDVGDEVLAIDPRSGELQPTRVVAIRSAERECVRLGLPGDRSLVCTGDHPLYDPQTESYAPATDWIDGKRTHVALLVEGRLEAVAVEAHDRYVGVHRVFDLTVEAALHNFIAGDCVVHNKSTYGGPYSYCDTDFGYNDQGECVMLSTTSISDTSDDSFTTGDSGTGGSDSSSSGTGGSDSGSSGTDGSDSGSSGTGGSDSGSSGTGGSDGGSSSGGG